MEGQPPVGKDRVKQVWDRTRPTPLPMEGSTAVYLTVTPLHRHPDPLTMSLYLLLKTVHIAAVIAWIGGIVGLIVLVLLAGQEEKPDLLAGIMRLSVQFGQRVIGPFSGIALLAGIILVATSPIRFMDFWVMYGFGGWAFHLVMGTTVLRQNGIELGKVAGSPSADRAQLARLLARQRTLALVYLLVMLTVVWVMVAKP